MTAQSPINPKILQRATDSARQLAYKIKAANTRGEIKTWGDLEKYGLELSPTDPAKDCPIRNERGDFYLIVEPFLERYVRSTESRLIAAQSNPADRRRLRLADPSACRRLGKYTLFREQEPVVQAIIDYLYNQENPGRLALVPAGTGSGKTQIAIGVIKHVLDNNIHLALGIPFPYPIIVLTVKNAIVQTKQRFIDCGLGDYLDKDIHVWSYSALTSSFGKERLCNIFTVTDPHTGIESQAIDYKPFACASLLVLDEVHSLAREDSLRTKALKAYDLAARGFPALKTKILAMSGSVNDATA